MDSCPENCHKTSMSLGIYLYLLPRLLSSGWSSSRPTFLLSIPTTRRRYLLSVSFLTPPLLCSASFYPSSMLYITWMRPSYSLGLVWVVLKVWPLCQVWQVGSKLLILPVVSIKWLLSLKMTRDLPKCYAIEAIHKCNAKIDNFCPLPPRNTFGQKSDWLK